MDDLDKRKISCPYPKLHSDHPAYSPNRQCHSGDNDNEPSGLKLLTVPFSLGSSVSSNNEVPVGSTNETKVQ